MTQGNRGALINDLKVNCNIKFALVFLTAANHIDFLTFLPHTCIQKGSQTGTRRLQHTEQHLQIIF